MNQDLLEKYIKGESSVEEREEVFLWAKADEKNWEKLSSLRKLYDIILWQQENKTWRNRSSVKNNRLFFYRVASVAAVLLFMLGVGFYVSTVKKQIPDTVMQTINVPVGQRVEVILADGTSVWLNAGSTFTFPNNFSQAEREVFLDGEGYFNVAKDEKRQFTVKTSTYNVKVLGTEFNVLAYSKSPIFDVSLLKGLVRVYSKNNTERVNLEPQTKAYLAGSRLHKEKITNFDYFLWKDGLICFDDETFDNVINKLELYYDVKIVLQNNSLKKQRYTGKFRTKDGVEHILKVFQLRDKFIYEKDDDKNVITIK